MKMWDVRSQVPLHTINSHTDKVCQHPDMVSQDPLGLDALAMGKQYVWGNGYTLIELWYCIHLRFSDFEC